MVCFFIPQDKLEDIISEEMDKNQDEQSNWFKIFSHQNAIFVSSLDDYCYMDYEEPLFIFCESYGVEIIHETDYIENIPNNPASTTRYPNGVFILNISEDEARIIQEEYGVICQSIDKMDDGVLVSDGNEFEPNKDDTEYDWNIILANYVYSEVPSNHLILIDRYLFADDYSEEMSSALQNIYEIINNLLPTSSLRCPYLISFFISQDVLDKYNLSLNEIGEEIDNIIDSLSRNYSINIEILSMRHHCGLYKNIHDRFIITNYSIIKISHMINAFEDGKSKCMQSITAKRLFTKKGLNDYCDSPIKMHTNVTDAIHRYFTWRENHPDVLDSRYMYNGQLSIMNNHNVYQKY